MSLPEQQNINMGTVAALDSAPLKLAPKRRKEPRLVIHPDLVLRAGELGLEADEIVVFLFLYDTQGKNRWSTWPQTKIGRRLGWSLLKDGSECRRVSQAIKGLRAKKYITVERKTKVCPDGRVRTMAHYSTDPLVERLGRVPRWKVGKPDPMLTALLGQGIDMEVFVECFFKQPAEICARLPENFNYDRRQVPVAEIQYLGIDANVLLEWLQQSRGVESKRLKERLG